jgi:hypothetical protein
MLAETYSTRIVLRDMFVMFAKKLPAGQGPAGSIFFVGREEKGTCPGLYMTRVRQFRVQRHQDSAARTSARRPALPSFLFLWAINLAYSAI